MEGKNLWTAKVGVVAFRKGIKAYEDVVKQSSERAAALRACRRVSIYPGRHQE